MATANHRCDGRCVCPIHGTPMYYSPTQDDHACQDPQCRHAHGVNDTRADRWLTDASQRATEDLASVLDVEAGLREVLRSDDPATPAPSDPGSGG